MRETFVIGDIHSCLDELQSLLDKINYDPSKVRLILLGDLTDRSVRPEQSNETISFVRKLNVECVASNHDIRYVRYFKHELLRKKTGVKNPIYLNEYKQSVYKSLSEDNIVWLTTLPFIINPFDNWLCIHAGFEPSKHLLEQDPDQIIRCRFVDDKGRAVKSNKDKSQPKGSSFWAETFDQPFNVVFGHNVFSEPRAFKNKNNECFGIDTGACFGGALTGFWLERKEFVQVKARKVYWKR